MHRLHGGERLQEGQLVQRALTSYANAFLFNLSRNRWQKTRKVGAQTETIKSYYNANDQLLRDEITELGGTLRTNYYAYDANGPVVAKTNATASTCQATLYGYDMRNKLSSAVTLVGRICKGWIRLSAVVRIFRVPPHCQM